jgi:hypothetical protein
MSGVGAKVHEDLLDLGRVTEDSSRLLFGVNLDVYG